MSSPGLQVQDTLLSVAGSALERASDYLLSLQKSEGYWWADLTADTTLESDYLLLLLWMHPPKDGVWNPPDRAKVDRAVRSILKRQLPDGGFNIYQNGPAEVSASVKAYFALKLAGTPVDSPEMTRLRERILDLGGIQACNSYVKINLNLFDLYPREFVPTVPPELALMGNVLYEMSSWTRAIVVSLAIVQSANPRRPVPAGFHLDELHKPGETLAFRNDEGFFSLRNVFIRIDQLLKFWDKYKAQSIRRRALKKCEAWMLERFRHSDGLGAIYPPMMYAIMALDVLGYPEDHPERVEAVRQFENLLTDDGENFYFQPCFSPVWDTAITGYALGEAASVLPRGDARRRAIDESLARCSGWLLTKEIRRKGDWAIKRPNTEPSGWAFEFANEFYPDIDDTAMVLLALAHGKAPDGHAQRACHERAVRWLLDMQSRDGGWAAFDVDNDWHFLSDVPFADHNAMLDPTCADITGRVIEGLCAHGLKRSHPAIERGVQYLVRHQLPDGSWYGRWGVAYIYGTCFALRGLAAAGESDREAHVLRAGEWLRSIQNADGGWGETCASYDNQGFTPAPSAPSQTGWALMGLIAGGDTNSLSVRKGIEYLAATQRPDGGWDEDASTGTGFPRVFYLNYHYYRHNFPLIALSSFLKSGETERS